MVRNSLIVVLLYTLTACGNSEECYECKINVSTPYAASQTTQEYCGTEDEKDDYERAGTYESTSSSGGQSFTVRTWTTCR